jgi:SAM-dependent methyltransferase
MEAREYELMADVEDRHWWFAGRRRIIDALLSSLALPKPVKILEVGCGTGGNFPMLAQYGDVKAAEMNEFARNKAASRNIAKQVEPANLPQQAPFAGEQFDVIGMFDVLEHIDRDVDSLRVVRERLKDDGKLCLTVPAMPFLWSAHDVANHHKRRYTMRSLKDVVTRAGFTPNYTSYFNVWFFPAVALVRGVQKLFGDKNKPAKSDLSMPPEWINMICEKLFSTERFFIGKINMPFGVSLIMSASKA